MKKFIFIVLTFSISLNLFAASEKIFNLSLKKSVLDVFTDPQNTQYWQRYTLAWDLCYKGDINEAHAKLLELKDQEVILSDYEVDAYVASEVSGDRIWLQIHSSKAEDDAEDADGMGEVLVERCPF